ncbi:MAG TPA: helix-turn-helix domain-containing protein [Allosphingosinicella sp.]|jgi:transcriptional regulator with XRE-family HTH domain
MAEFESTEMQGGTVGARLKAAREAKAISLDDIARQTRIPVRHLEHIERSEWEALPAITYSVGFVRSYGNAVGLDGAALGAEVREQLGGARHANPAAAAYYEPADPARVPPRSMAIITAVLALLLVGGYLLWRSTAVDPGSAESVLAESETAAPAAPNPQAAVRPAPQPAAPATGPVVLTAREEVWLSITDGSQRLFMGTMKAGDRYEVPAAAQAPQIVTGRPNVLQVTVGAAQIPPLGPPEKRIKGVSLRAADLAARLQAPGAAPAPPAQAPVPIPAR